MGGINDSYLLPFTEVLRTFCGRSLAPSIGPRAPTLFFFGMLILEFMIHPFIYMYIHVSVLGLYLWINDFGCLPG